MKRKIFATYLSVIYVIVLLITGGCVSSRYVPEGGYLLDQVNIEVNDSLSVIRGKELVKYLRQEPNHKIFSRIKLRLGLYNMSGSDSTKWYNRWWRRMGEPPVVYDSVLESQTLSQFERVMVNRGFLHGNVKVQKVCDEKKRKVRINYTVNPGAPSIIRNIDYDIADDKVRQFILADSLSFPVTVGSPLDRQQLEMQRDRIVNMMRNNGYYAFRKDAITFNADTTTSSPHVDLTMKLSIPVAESDTITPMSMFIVRKVIYVTDYELGSMGNPWEITPDKVVDYKGVEICYGEKEYLRPSVLYDNCFIRPGGEYSEEDVKRTYQALSRMSILNYINIRFNPVGHWNGIGLLDAYILLTPGKSQSAGLSVEGTNSEGDLGVAVGLTYSHRNIDKGSETLTVKGRGAYESISGDFDGFIHNRYMEYGIDAGVRFPKFKAPFLRERFKRRINASTELKMALNYQERPEYTRIISTAGWSYHWTERLTQKRHIFTPVDINYVYLPESTNGFIDQIAPDNPLLRYSYEDHFIMRMGYGFYHTNKPALGGMGDRIMKSNVFSWRVNVEVAGNFLFAINSIFTHRSNFHQNPYKIFGIHYAQYVRGEGDYSLTHFFDNRQSIAFRVGAGVGVPYGNSKVMPFEKRFYGGGANGVRGWQVRTLGPGSYDGSNALADFIHQCGDIKLDLGVEYRARLFWIIEGALFADAGNVWTIHDYPSQPGGMFRFNTFYKQIAASYGAGIRFDFTYFLLRFDLAMKAHNPAMGAESWPLFHPRWHRDSAFHFSIGYPF